MGSEHYCLRWNNHQSNLLGVFSQLLQDESLVDVTLACSEGASIRAHKVVLSACSSYFQSLFLDHPDRYPIVVLKDVRFAELRTLVEFMYKGEVNVQYCQLSALLKTAESLKVKGLAEMTNQNAPLQHDTDHEPSERLRSTSAQHHLQHHHQQQLHTQTSIDHELSTSKQQRLANSECSPSPPIRLLSHHQQQQRSSISPPPSSATTTTSGAYYNISKKASHRSGESHLHHHDTSHIKVESGTSGGRDRDRDRDRDGEGSGGRGGGSISVISGNCDENINNDESMVTNETKLRLHSPNDERMSIKQDGEVGLNMTLSAQPIPNSNPSQTSSTIIPPINSTHTSTTINDLRPSSRTGISILGISGNGCGNSVSDRLSRGGNLGSPTIHEPIPGPSGVREPMQHEPLSLKKEIDWGDRSDDKSPGECSLSEYRHSHDVFSPHQFGILPGRGSIGGSTRSRSLTPSLSSQFAFPFLNTTATATSPSAQGLGLFDTDPSRLLQLLHHQTLLAEEALRYRGLLFGGAAAANLANTKEPPRISPLTEMLMKEQQEHFSKFSPIFKDAIRYPLFMPDLSISRASSSSSGSTKLLPEDLRSEKQRGVEDNFYKRPRSLISSEPGHFEAKRLKECREFLRNATPSPIATSLSSLMTLRQMDASMLNDHSVDSQLDKEIKCHICMANFPSTWLLEQHTALQHPTLHQNKGAGSSRMHDEKPFKCEECGETSRYNCCKYRSTYATQTSDQNHRARIPADKLFTCDVCGMQFRYLKSFKKHRLNHALERLHGKKEKLGDNEPVSSTNENEGVDLSGIKDEENVSEEEDQDNTIDSAGASSLSEHMRMLQDRHSAISSSAMDNGVINLDTDAQRGEPEPSSSSLTSLTTLINSETIPSQLLGLNPQEASILNFLRVDAAEKQRDRRFACPFCGKCVRSKENLKLHVRKHTGERPFVCLFCGRAFGGKSDLTRHLRIHTGERPYHCEACGKCFARADYLSKHLTTHVHNGPRG